MPEVNVIDCDTAATPVSLNTTHEDDPHHHGDGDGDGDPANQKFWWKSIFDIL